jgi:hypothetical protein
MNKKKIESIRDYMDATKPKEKDSDDFFLYFDPMGDALFPSGLELAIMAGVIIFSIVLFLIFVH